jgi:hypothetical protein
MFYIPIVAIQIMWARWMEGAVLLFARGLGVKGEMDTVAEEEAHLLAWMDQQKEADASADGRGSKGTQVLDFSEPPTVGGYTLEELDEAFESALGTHASLFCGVEIQEALQSVYALMCVYETYVIFVVVTSSVDEQSILADHSVACG